MTSTRAHARAARARAKASLRSMRNSALKSNADTAGAPDTTPIASPERLEGLSPPLSSKPNRQSNSERQPRGQHAEPEFNFPTEQRRFLIRILKRCPWCNTKPEIERSGRKAGSILFTVVHPPISPDCQYGKGISARSMKGAINRWNFAVSLSS